ncbi:MAG: hypothetical protein M1813_007405 [Trichoglossum hirsutum]|nr:MAG: hypothetical protein M1813_007405 [Trichoglossum hirsutum]
MLYVRCTGRRMNENDAREVFKIDGPLKKRYARNTSSFPTERQRVQLPMILITAAYPASRPGELVDAGRKKKEKKPGRMKEGYEPWDGLDDSDYDDNRLEDEEKRCKSTML